MDFSKSIVQKKYGCISSHGPSDKLADYFPVHNFTPCHFIPILVKGDPIIDRKNENSKGKRDNFRMTAIEHTV
ncbi:hypothetical protein [uncultured Dialister sp.]|uniref:hypothetical protein n=1 Tax=uncultured Dialister sp. TaxID=278064 RepID=UPI0025CC96CB|nr:hypothetical protein [uncultured Dialister sp.]